LRPPIPPTNPPDHKFEKACELYSEAIKLHPTAILYANRAMAAIKMESYGVALADAEAALECVYFFGVLCHG
jgi:tetratricopeptide (TPR) repeat protein